MNDMLAFAVWNYVHQQRAEELYEVARRERLLVRRGEDDRPVDSSGKQHRFRWPLFARRTAGMRTA